jgi:hypothetical protein
MWLACLLLSACSCWRLYLCRSQDELNTHLAPQALFVLGMTATATSFPLSKRIGEGDTAPAFSGHCVYLQFMWEVGLPPLLWSFPPTTTCTSFPASGCWVCAAAPAFSSLLVRDFPSPTPFWCSRCPALFATCLFCCYCLLFSFFFFFPWVGVSLSRGLCWSGPGLFVGVLHTALLTLWSACCQAVWALLSGGGTGALLVSPFNLKWRWYVQAGGVEEWKFCFSQWFFLYGVSPVSLQDFTLGGTLPASSL